MARFKKNQFKLNETFSIFDIVDMVKLIEDIRTSQGKYKDLDL